MSNLYNHMKRMCIPAEFVGEIKGVSVDENWIGMMDRVTLNGITPDGRKFEMTLEIMNKEEEKDA